MDIKIAIIFLSFIIGLVLGVLITNRKNTVKRGSKEYNLVSGVKTVLYIYLAVLSALLIYKIFDLIDPNITMNEFFDANIISIMSAFGSVFLGAMAVILSRREYQDKQREEILDEIIGPLYFEIKDMKENLLLDTINSVYAIPKLEQWEKISGTHNEIRAHNIDDHIPLFYDEIDEFTSTLMKIKYQIDAILNAYFNQFIFESLGYAIMEEGTANFWITYITKLERKHMFLTKAIIFGEDPMGFSEWDPLFDEKNCEFTINKIARGPEDDYGNIIPLMELRYLDYKVAFQEMLKALESEISKESHIQLIRKKRLELIDIATTILTILESYIES